MSAAQHRNFQNAPDFWRDTLALTTRTQKDRTAQFVVRLIACLRRIR
jgi:hypothetical protein